MSSVPCKSSPELGFGSRISELLDPEVGHNRGQIFVNQLRFAPSVAPQPAHPNVDAGEIRQVKREEKPYPAGGRNHHRENRHQHAEHAEVRDRKSTRLNSSHLVISYAVFCLKKK